MERICKQCTSGEVEDEMHFVLHCEAPSEERRKSLNMLILERACNDDRVGRESWRRCGGADF